MTDFKATPDQWEYQKHWAAEDGDAACLLELRDRVEAITKRLKVLEAKGFTKAVPLKKPTMRPFPDEDRLRIFWRVAVTSAIEGQGETYEIFARCLYHYLVGNYDHTTIKDAPWLDCMDGFSSLSDEDDET